VTGIISHTRRRIAWGQSRYTYLLETGKIPIRLVPVSSGGNAGIPVSPGPETRYFEVEIDEVRKQGRKTAVFQNISPVSAHKNPDWRILKFRIRRGRWKTERIPSRHEAAGLQWIYTDDFNILFLSSGGRHDHATLINLIAAKLDAITQSVLAGKPCLSEYESQRACRDAFGTIFSDGVGGAFRETLLYRQQAGGAATAQREPGTGMPVSGAGIAACHGKAATPAGGQSSGMNVDVTQIDELNDLSWLTE
jgi:hypothetical protein